MTNNHAHTSNDGTPDIAQVIHEQLKAHTVPTPAQIERLLEQMAMAEVEIALLRTALLDATQALEATLQALSHTRHLDDLPDDEQQETKLLAAVYHFLFSQAH